MSCDCTQNILEDIDLDFRIKSIDSIRLKYERYYLDSQTRKVLRKLNDAAPRRGIQVVTISRPSAFGEYAPYSFVESEEKLLKAVKEM